jgi:hypothetical protein
MAIEKKNSSSRGKKVWHIADFRELFELPDDLRKDRPGPLSYTKSFVALSGLSKESEIRHFERLQELKARPERHLLRSVFEDLKNWSGKKTIRHRGYFLTTSEQPASYEYLAAQLQLNVTELKKAIPILEQIGLIERVPFSVWRDNDRLYKATKKRKKSVKKGTRSSQRKTGTSKKNKKPDLSGRIRTEPDEIGSPLKNDKGNGKGKSKGKSKINGNPKRKIKNDNSNRKHNVKAIEKQENRAAKTTTAPTTAPPFVPQDSAALSRPGTIKFPACSAAVKDNRGPAKLGDVAEGILHRYNPEAKQFAFEIYQALELPWDPTSKEGKRELGCFCFGLAEGHWHTTTGP